MLVVISPAKAMTMDPAPDLPMTQPRFAQDASHLAAVARGLSVDDLAKLMSISDKLAQLNYDRFQGFDAPGETKQAAMAFAGDTYKGLEFKTIDADAQAWAQDHLRMLSGLYGVLRPFDMIRAYRLEMGSRLKTDRGASLYAYWGDRIAEALVADAQAIGTDRIVNCASTEYFKAADRKSLALRVITPRFLEDKGGAPKIISFYAKQARGAMARFITEQRITRDQDLLEFDTGGYRHSAELSTEASPAFVRVHPA